MSPLEHEGSLALHSDLTVSSLSSTNRLRSLLLQRGSILFGLVDSSLLQLTVFYSSLCPTFLLPIKPGLERVLLHMCDVSNTRASVNFSPLRHPPTNHHYPYRWAEPSRPRVCRLVTRLPGNDSLPSPLPFASANLWYALSLGSSCRLFSNCICRQLVARESNGRGVTGSPPPPFHSERSASIKGRPRDRKSVV